MCEQTGRMEFIRLLLVLLIAHESFGQFSGCDVAPDTCPNENITFWLYTRNTQNTPYQLDVAKPDSIKNANFISGVPIVILIHGYTGDKDFAPNAELRPAYFERGEYNIISVDWHPWALDSCYLTAVQNVPIVGKCSAQLIDTLVQNKGIALERFHVVGFSLGAQVAGAIGNWIKSGQLERVTGLDPALPLFVTPDPKGRLDKSDAKFVDVIHTNALEKGKLEASGHADFYLNGGVTQPGCENQKNLTVSGCSHWRAPLYYAESINSQKGFYGMKCSSWFLFILGWCPTGSNTEEAIMGEDAKNTTQGLYFVDTNSESPYAKGTWAEQHPQKDNETFMERDYIDDNNIDYVQIDD